MSEETQIQQEETNPPTQSYISRVRLKGYKSIIDTEVTFKPGLNIIIGANGSGKTNFVEFLKLILKSEFNEISPTYSALVEFFFNKIHCLYDIDHIMIKPDGFVGLVDGIKEKLIVDDVVKIDGDNYNNWFKISSLVEWNSVEPIFILYDIPKEFSQLQNIRKFEIVRVKNIKAPIFFSNPEPKLTSGLNELLYETFIMLLYTNVDSTGNNSDFYSLPIEYKRYISDFTPVKHIRISSNYNFKVSFKEKLELENLKFEFSINDEWLTWNQLSDGTKRMIYIITEITFANNIVLLEEPELGIHPDQLRKLMSFLREQAQEKQIIITTHSPQVLNALAADELDRIIIARYEKEAGTKLYHLTEDEIAHARSYMETEGLFLSDYWVYSGFEKEEEAV